MDISSYGLFYLIQIYLIIISYLQISVASSIINCIDLLPSNINQLRYPSHDFQKFCVNEFLKGVPGRTKHNTDVSNYIHSLLRKSIKNKQNQIKRHKRQTTRQLLQRHLLRTGSGSRNRLSNGIPNRRVNTNGIQNRRRINGNSNGISNRISRANFRAQNTAVTPNQNATINITQNRIRYEVRHPDYDMVWGRFANRTQRLANFSSVRTGMSDYGILASLHSGDTLKSVYGGPAYLAWQRIYLLLFEAAIGVPVPYWDCSLDFHMRDPTRSVVWSPKYFGNGFGELTTGPFKDFKTPGGSHIFRNIGSDGTLFSKQSIELIMSRNNQTEITEPLEDQRYSLEGHALGVLVWIDGTISRSNMAAYDPIYFPIHSFIDLLWERFREQMIALHEIDPALEYPHKGSSEYKAQNRMKFEPHYSFIPQFRNIQGYSRAVGNMITFSPLPDCPECLNTTELYCSNQDICIAREVQENFPVPIPESRQKQAKHLSSFARGAMQGPNPKELPKDEEDTPARTLAALASGFQIEPGPKFQCPFRDVRTRGDPIPASPNSSPRG